MSVSPTVVMFYILQDPHLGMASFSMFGSLGAAVQVVLILHPFCAFKSAGISRWRCTAVFIGDGEPWMIWFCLTRHNLVTSVCSLTSTPSATWWCPRWWASIAPLCLQASCLAPRTPTSRRYLSAAPFTGPELPSVASFALWPVPPLAPSDFRSSQTVRRCSSWARRCPCSHARSVRTNCNSNCKSAHFGTRHQPCFSFALFLTNLTTMGSSRFSLNW